MNPEEEPSKICTMCKAVKPLDEFYRRKGVKDGRTSNCKACRNAHQREKRSTPEYRKSHTTYELARYHKNRESILAHRQQRRDENPEILEKSREYQKKWREELKKRHGMTKAEKIAWLDEIGWMCQICRDPFDDVSSAHVDHDHSCCPGKQSCGKCIRGALCGHCNRALGILKDDVSIIESAAQYLRSYQSDEQTQPMDPDAAE